MDKREVELDPTKGNDYLNMCFLKQDCRHSDVIFYLQVGNIRLSLDQNRWKSPEADQLLEDAKRVLDDTYCEDRHVLTLFHFSTAIENTELLITLIKKGFQIDQNNIRCIKNLNEDILDALIEQGATKQLLTETVYNQNNRNLDLLEHLDNKIGIDLNFFYVYPSQIYRSPILEMVRFILRKIADTTENFDIHQYVTEDIVHDESVDVLRLLVDDFGLDPRNYISTMLDRLQLFEESNEFCLFSFPYIEQHIGLFDVTKVLSQRPHNVIRTCAYLLCLGVDFYIIKESLDLAYPECEPTDRYYIIDGLKKKGKISHLRYAKILKDKLLDFFEQKVITKSEDNSELYYEFCKIADEKVSIELLSSEIIDTRSFTKWADYYIHYWRSVGVHMYVADTKIQILERDYTDSPRRGYGEIFKNFCNIFRSVSDIITSERVTQQDKDALLMICFDSPMKYEMDTHEKRDIFTDFVQDYTNTIILLLQHGADLNKVLICLTYTDSSYWVDVTRGSETLVDLVIETDPGAVGLLFISAVDRQHINIVGHILQKYPHEITFSIIQKSRFIYSCSITMLVVNHLTEGCDVEYTKNIVQELISEEILVDFIRSMGNCYNSVLLEKEALYSYLLQKGLDCRAHDDIVANRAVDYGLMSLIQISLPYRLKADKKTVCQDLVSVITSFNYYEYRYICFESFDDIVESILTSGAFAEEPELLLEVLKQYQYNSSWSMSETYSSFAENKMKYKLDAMFDEYATAIIGLNYRDLLRTDN